MDQAADASTLESASAGRPAPRIVFQGQRGAYSHLACRQVCPAYEALPDGGAYIVIENLIDDARRENAFGLMMSLNMLIEFGDAFDFTGGNFAEWCREAGFRDVAILHLTGPASAGIAYK